MGAVKSVLDALPAINNVKFDLGPDLYQSIVVGGSQRPDFSKGDEVCSPRAMELDFDLYIPVRVQDALMERQSISSPRSEHFRLYFRDTYHGEVAFVRPLGAADEDASTAVAVVREFLLKHLEDPSGRVAFECLGPSPFHAEFSLSLGVLDYDSRFSVKPEMLGGYARLDFIADSTEFSSEEDAIAELMFDLSGEFGLYYKLIQLRVQAMDEWLCVHDEFVDMLQPVGFWKKLFWPSASLLKTMITRLAQFEMSQVMRLDQAREMVRSQYSAVDATFFLKVFTQQAHEEVPAYPTEQIGRLLSFHEHRLQKRLEFIVVCASSVLGGAVGSLITLAATA